MNIYFIKEKLNNIHHNVKISLLEKIDIGRGKTIRKI